MRTLLVDDDPAFRRLAGIALEAAGVEHESVSSASEALKCIESTTYDLVLLDMELPGMNGEELVRHLRAKGHDIPVVFVSVHDGEAERARGLRAGADDYLVKPLSFEELLARLRAVLRRSRGSRSVRLGDLEIDPAQRRVTRDGQAIELTQREFEVLWVLLQAQERTVTRKEFLLRVWSMHFDPGTNLVEVHVSRLRAKLGASPAFSIETVRGQGYRLTTARHHEAVLPSPRA